MKNKKGLLILVLTTITVFSLFMAACGNMGDSNVPGGSILPDFSQTGGTLTQELTVDEGDVVKLFGNKLYKLQSDGLTVWELEGGNATRIAYFESEGSRIVPIEMFVADGIVVGVFGKSNQADPLYSYHEGRNADYAKTSVMAFDANAASKENEIDLKDYKLYSFDISAKMLTTRMYVSSKKMYFAFNVVNNYNSYQETDSGYQSLIPYLPVYSENDEIKKVVSFDPIPQLHSENGTIWQQGSSATVFMSIDGADLSKPCQISGCYGATLQDLYMSETSIIPIYKNTYRKTETQGCGSKTITNHYSYAMMIDSESLRIVDGVRFENYEIKDRRSIKDFGDYIYITATKDDGTGSTVVSFDGRTFSKLNTLLKVAPNEDVKSVAYEEKNGERYCYITTFREVDPLFKVNITDPYRMVTEGYLKISGYSTFMYPVGNRLLTLGYADNGAQNRESIVRIAMYETVDGITPVDELLIPNVIYCEALSDPRCISVYGNVVSFTMKTSPTRGTAYHGLYLFMITDTEIVQLPTLSNYGKGETYGLMGETVMYNNKYYLSNQRLLTSMKIQRARYLDGYLYTVADGVITSYKVNEETYEIDLSSIKQIPTNLKTFVLHPFTERPDNSSNGNSSSIDSNFGSGLGGNGNGDVEPDYSSGGEYNSGGDYNSGDGNFDVVD